MALVRCTVAKYVDPDQVVYNDAVQQRMTSDAEAFIKGHMKEGEEFSKTEESSSTATGRTSNVLKPQFFEDQALWYLSGSYPLIYKLETADVFWGENCNEVGYWYFLENWMYKYFSQKGHLAIVQDYKAADYVYVPLCIRRQLFLASQDVEISATEAIKYNAYKGLLVEEAIDKVDADLVTAIGKLRGNPAFKSCMERASCRFLFCSIDGRHVYQNFSDAFGDKAVWLTHMGAGDWSARERGLYWTDRSNLEMRGAPAALDTGRPRDEKPPEGCRAACKLHCQLEPPSMLPNDIIMPWMIGFMFTKRAREWRSRDLFAFFSGAESCCARGLLFRTFRNRFISAVRSPHSSLSRETLVFPPTVKLEQARWSELAHRSRICLIPDGDCPATGRLIEVMMHGCVPMIITNRLVPPVNDYIDWKQVAFFVREDEIPALPGILAMIQQQPRKLQQMHENLFHLARFLDYTLDFPVLMLVRLRRLAEDFREKA